MANTVDKVIKIATAEIGYLEKSKTAYNFLLSYSNGT